MSSAGERSLNKQLVLDEDEYTAALSHIIARDFFPSLAHLDATNEYLDALQTRDPHLIGASVRRIDAINNTPDVSSIRRTLQQTPSQTPYAFGPSDTPLRTPAGEPLQKRARLNTDLSLDKFQARYTSEDNSSFTQILDSENQKRKEKWSWAWDAQKLNEAQRDKMIEGRERMLVEAPAMAGVREKFVIEAPTVAGLLMDKAENQEREGQGRKEDEENPVGESSEENKGKGKAMVIVQNDSGETEVDILAPKKDTRAAGVDGWKFKARNSLMFPPDADASPYHSVEILEKVKDPKIIKYGNTRLDEDNHTTSVTRGASAPPSPTRSRIEAAIMGTPYRPKTPPGQFNLVPNLPSPTAAELGPAAVKQLMTWGTLNATPRVIAQGDDLPTPSTPFHIPATSSRENLSRKLANKASKSLRAKAELLGLTPGIKLSRKSDMGPPSMTPRRSQAAGNLTPAAKRLLERTTMGTAASKRAEAMERSSRWDGGSSQVKEKDLNRVRWTPTPNSVR